MRILLALALVGVAAVSATANPRSREDSMRSRVDSTPRSAPPASRTAPEAPRRATPGRPEVSRREVPVVDDTTMPVLWTELRIKVIEQLPSGGRDLGFTYTVMPMAITGAGDTTAPALGISGTF